ncbi:MAG: ABC transporter permease [Roseivirga sp.]
MLKQLFVFAFRSFRKSRLTNGLNIIGLTLGLSVFFLTALFVYQEQSYEHDFSKRARTYQIGTSFFSLGKTSRTSSNLHYVLSDIPGVISHTTFWNNEQNKIFTEGEDYQERRVIKADENFFDVFEFDLLAGDVNTVLNDPNQVVINEQVAIEMFGTTDVLGKELKVGTYLFNYETAIIKAVSKSPEFKTQLDFDILLSQNRGEGLQPDDWGAIGYYVYAVLDEGVERTHLDEQLVALNKRVLYPKYGQERGGHSYEEWLSSDDYIGFFAESLEELRYDSQTQSSLMPKADKNRTNTLIIIGLASLLISVINFINLSTARASLRMKEVAVKRIMGSARQWLIAQFMLESFVVIALSSILALASVEAFIIWQPAIFNGFIEYSVLQSGEWMLMVITFVLSLSLLSGVYPALYLSSGNVVTILKGGLSKGSFSLFNATLLRRAAIVVQFICSIGLIGAVITMSLQINHLKNRDLGYEASDVVVIDNIHDLDKNVDVFRQELLKIPAVTASGYANAVPAERNQRQVPTELTDKEGRTHMVTYLEVESSFFKTMDLEMLAGVAFDLEENDQPLIQGNTRRKKKEGKLPVVLNEMAVRTLGLENPVGSILNDMVVVGVVEDFMFSDLNTATEAMVIMQMAPVNVSSFFYNPLFIELNSYSAESRGAVETLWASLTDRPMKSFPMTARYERLIAAENAAFSAVLIFSVFAVLVSCIGLFGLAMFTVDQRLKEFGIRKVLGATVPDIIRLFSWDFLKLVLLAFLMAMPVAMYALNLWLNGFASRINLSYSIVLFTGLTAALIAIATVLFQSIKAGRLNPVDTLRNE